MGRIALVIHVAIPLAPPRMLPGYIDAGATFGPDPYSFPGSQGANQFAAMPSVHVAWALLVGWALWSLTERPSLRFVAVAHPLLTAAVVIVTGNHFVADVAIGALLSAAAIALLLWPAHRSRQTQPERVWFRLQEPTATGVEHAIWPSLLRVTVIEIPFPDDWHVHLRDDEMLEAVVGYTARRFRYAMVMPNLASPLVSVASAVAYRERIRAAVPADAPDFRPLLTLYCSAHLDLADLRHGLESGTITAIKYYPAGATTNSAAGGTSMAAFMGVYELLAEFDARLLVHAEATDPTIDIFDREAAFLERELAPLCERMPELAVTVEHVSTAAGVDFVAAHPQAVATITPHHLARDRSDLLANGMKPDLYCKPVINSADDQARLVAAATSGEPAFFLGTDSAPHPTTAKYGPTAKAGVFNAAYGLEVVADVFDKAGATDQLARFVSENGRAAYGVEPPTHRLRLTKTEVDTEVATHLTTTAGDEVVLFGTDEASRWRIETLERSET